MRFHLLTLAVTLGLSSPLLAGDSDNGRQLAQACASCHGPTGRATSKGYPNLDGQNAAYLEKVLRAYRDRSRKGAMAFLMYPEAAELSDDQIEDLAAFYASQ
ncbi:c-type cytochrome [Marinobacterium arenosum]|uniref:c-type cytochrome n=1 Tax=Marinobacterium arenosum TaxID=2862496 RepID=UPI001C9385F4|nr:cytochrome c [Marinobacterium arenosum]MBY4679072.1 cytochrome c [Marinobacterium arenosum]